MGTRVVDVNGEIVVLAMEAPLGEGRRPWAIVQGRVVDELVGLPPDVEATIDSPRAGLSPRAAPGGLVALAGIPELAFPALATQAYPVPYSVRAPGYVSLAGETQLPLDALFPSRFQPVQLGDLEMHRLPTTITGVVWYRTAAGLVPVSGATVTVTEIWPVAPPPDGSVPAVAPMFASLRPPLNANRSTATGRLRDLDVVPVLGQDKELLDDVEPDRATLRVSNRDGLVAGGVILVDADPAIQEIATIQTIDAVGTPDLPARLTLGHPLWFRHRRGSRVRPATLQAPGADIAFDRAAIRGDVCVFPASLTGLALNQVVEVHGGAPRELHRLFRFEVRTDGDGRYRMPPLSRVAQLTVVATPAVGSPSDPVTFVPDYSRGENQLDITL